MVLTGKLYEHERDENFEAFIDSLGIAQERAAIFKLSKPSQKLEKNGDIYTLTANFGNDNKQISFKLGEEFDENVSPIRVAKTVFTLDGNVLHQVQKFHDGYIVITTREYLDDTLIVTLTNNKWDGKAVRYYKA